MSSGLHKIDVPKWHRSEVTLGIHACRTLKFAHTVMCDTNNPFLFPAIIPKGSKYYIGNNKDIVSTNLIVFENEFRYEEYKTKRFLE